MSKKTTPDYSAYKPKANIKAIGQFFLQHPGFALFIFYSMTATAGFIYLLSFYAQFDFKAIGYLEISDILVAGVKDPLVMLMVLFSFALAPLMWLFTVVSAPFSAWWDKTLSASRLKFLIPLFVFKTSRSFWFITLGVVVLYFGLFILLHSKDKAALIKQGSEQKITIIADGLTATEELSLLGTSVNYIFAYSHADEQVLVLPIENVQKIIIKPTDKLTPADTKNSLSPNTSETTERPEEAEEQPNSAQENNK